MVRKPKTNYNKESEHQEKGIKTNRKKEVFPDKKNDRFYPDIRHRFFSNSKIFLMTSTDYFSVSALSSRHKSRSLSVPLHCLNTKLILISRPNTLS